MKKIFFMLAVLAAGPALAFGPRTVTTSGAVVKWSMPVTVHLETDLTVRGKNVGTLIEDALKTWENVTEAAVTITRGTLGTAVDSSNVCNYLYGSTGCPNGPTNDGLNPLVIDADGSIVEKFFGVSQKFGVLGFATINFYNTTTGLASKGEAVFNASCLNGVALSGCSKLKCSSFSDDDFTSFVVHEMGHFLGLNHSQVNLTEYTDSDPSNDSLIGTMLPVFTCGSGSYFKTPEKDDRVGIAFLYPASNFASTTWKLTGTVFDKDGTTQFQCANVIARNQANPRLDAVSFVSGGLAQPKALDGSFTLPGLTPGATYTLEVEQIYPSFTGSSGLAPCTGQSGEPLPPTLDSVTSSKTYTGTAGQTVTGATITLTSESTNVGLTSTDSSGGSSSGGTSTPSSSSGGCSLIPF